jgi:hypothetical protein
MAEQEKENDFVAPTSTTTTTAPPFGAGDHVVLRCNAAGVIPYEHLAIVVSIGQEICGGWTLCVSDFTIDGDGGEDGGSGGGIGSVGVGSVGGIGSARGLVTSLANIRGEYYGTTDHPAAGTAEGGEDHHRASTPAAAAAAAGHRRGLRLLCVDAGGWIRIAYADDAPVDCAAVVRKRVEFLLRNPHIIPPYSLVECNCECVAVWCKTGRWTTAQFRNWAGNANLASRIAVAGLSIASWSAIVVVPGAALLLSAGVVAEVVTGVWGDRARRGWEMRTALLNDEFDRTTMTTATATATTATATTTTTTATIPAINGGVKRI